MQSQGNLFRESYQDFSRAQVIRGFIKRAIRTGGTFSYDVIDEEGNIFSKVSFLNPVGGSHNSFMVVPVFEGQEVYLLKTIPNDLPYIIGTVFHPSHQKVQEFTSYMPISKEVDAISKNDLVFHNLDNQINLSASNGLIFNSDNNIRMALGNDGCFKISKDGKGGDYILNGAQFLLERKNYIDELDAKIVKMEEHLGHLTNTVNAVITGLQSLGVPASASTPVVGSALALTMSTALTPNSQSQTANGELQALPKRTTAVHTQDCAKALNKRVIVPKTDTIA